MKSKYLNLLIRISLCITLILICSFNTRTIKTIKDVLIIEKDVTMIPLLKAYASCMQLSIVPIFMLAYFLLKNLKNILIFFFITIQLFLGGFLLAQNHFEIQWIEAFKAFYILAEVFTTITASILLFAFFNQHFSEKEAKWVYPIFIILGNITITLPILILSITIAKDFLEVIIHNILGNIAITLPALNLGIANNFLEIIMYDKSGIMLLLSIPLIVFCLQKLGNKTELPQSYAPIKPVTIRFTAAYFILLFTLMFCILMAQEIHLPILKDFMKTVHTDINAYNFFMGQFSFLKGLFTFTAIIIGSLIFYFLSWYTTALVLPIFLILASLLTGYFSEHSDIIAYAFAPDMGSTEIKLWILTIFHICFSGLTPIFFFILKEMAYIPLPLHTKTVGKISLELLVKFMTSIFILVIGGIILSQDSMISQLHHYYAYVGATLGIISFISAMLLGKMRLKLTT